MMYRTAIGLTVLALGALLPGVARADRLDLQLNKEMPRVVEYLRGKGYRNVGVLRFRVQKGMRVSRFDNAPLNGDLATRIENLLVIHSGPDEKKALGVIHDAGGVAARRKVGSWYSVTAQRRKLFRGSYPLAWKGKPISPDVFLTGLVRTTPDLKRTTVRLECFDRKNPTQMKQVAQFTLKTDRNLVRDLGYSFALSPVQRKGLVAKRAADQVDENTIEAVNDQGGENSQKPNQKPQNQKLQVSPANIAGVKVQMMVDDKAREISKSPTQGAGPGWQVESPKPGQKIYFALTNTTDKRLGVVLKLNGVSTVDQQKDPSDGCRKWVIPPGKTFKIRGFYMVKNDGGQTGGGQGGQTGGQGTGGQDDQATQAGQGRSAGRGDTKKKPVKKQKAVKRNEDDDGPKNDENPGDNGGGQQPFGQKGKTPVLPFKVLVGQEAAAMKAQLGDKYGLIEIDVYAEGKTDDEDLQVSAKGLPPAKDKAARGSYKALRTALLKSARLKTQTVVRKEVIVPDEKAAGTTSGIKQVDFTGYVVGHLAIRVLPREDNIGD